MRGGGNTRGFLASVRGMPMFNFRWNESYGPYVWEHTSTSCRQSESLAPLVEVGPTHLNHFLDRTRSPLVPSPLPQLLQKAGLFYDMFLRLGLSTVRRSHPVSGWLGGSWLFFNSNVEALLSYMATFPELVQKLEQCAMPRYSVSAKHIFLEGAWNSWLRHSAVVTRALPRWQHEFLGGILSF